MQLFKCAYHFPSMIPVLICDLWKDADGNTPLTIAKIASQEDIVGLLEERSLVHG